MAPHWQQRIDRSTPPAIANEHVARYRFAAPLIQGAALWCDLGCGAGIAARDALEARPAERVVLIDADPEALEAAKREFSAADPSAVRADLSDAGDLDRLEQLVTAASGDRCITAFEVVEHLSGFSELVTRLSRLSDEQGFDVLLSVPNDAFWSIHNPAHETMWSGEALDELRGLLPAEHVVARQLPLHGSSICPLDGEEQARFDLSVDVSPDNVPSHHLVAFGPRAGSLTGLASVVQTDLDEQRGWERQRSADLEYLMEWERERSSDLEYLLRREREAEEAERRVAELEARVAELEAGRAAHP